MSDDENDSLSAWLIKAQSDLASAEVLLANKPAILDTACFHCQQAAEKYLKAFLVFKEVKFGKTHSMTYLINLCIKAEPVFVKIQEQAETLKPFAVEIRYPGAAVKPSSEEADEALSAAKTIRDFVQKHLPDSNP